MFFTLFSKAFVNDDYKMFTLKRVGHHQIQRLKVLLFNKLQNNKRLCDDTIFNNLIIVDDGLKVHLF